MNTLAALIASCPKIDLIGGVTLRARHAFGGNFHILKNIMVISHVTVSIVDLQCPDSS